MGEENPMGINIPQVVQEMGVVGAGGGGFPTHIKLSRPCEIVIANGAECEPLLFNDKLTMRENAEAIVEGLLLAMSATGAKKGVIALKEKDPLARQNILKAIEDKKNLSVFLLGDYYPAGDEFCLVKEVTGKTIPEGQIPLAVGAVVLNVETLSNIAAAAKGQPVTRRTLTCLGEVKQPSVLRVPVGTPFQDVFDACGGVTVSDYAILIGGPMMGSVTTDPLTPVTKTTTGLFVLPRDHELVQKKSLPLPFIIKQSKAACCQCTYCTELCPRYLLGHSISPHKIMRQINLGLDVPPQIIEGAFLCSECGLCEVYACPMGLSPRIVNRVIKEQLLKEGYRPAFPQRKIQVRDTFPYRKIPVSILKNRLRLYNYEIGDAFQIKSVEPKRVELLLKQHAGAPAQPVVKVGDWVKEGDLVGESAGEISARIHSSIEGKVIFVNEERIIIEKQNA
ncbi:MAG: hypothetical protein PWP42_39 [Candidatus Atribacteria bacterium]|jgi:Na+-translocating ferredoxin:NAD+ oxidoreductase RnfC subunit|nr:hypothetical protein [Candidatus Atribacteria bacterium]